LVSVPSSSGDVTNDQGAGSAGLHDFSGTSALVGLGTLLAWDEHPMMRPGVVLLLAYLSLDLGNPFMPGVFCFDADASLEATRASQKSQAGAAPSRNDAPRSWPPLVLGLTRTTAAAPQPMTAGAWRSERPRTYAAAWEVGPPAPGDDH
jgi:hypothetical protein